MADRSVDAMARELSNQAARHEQRATSKRWHVIGRGLAGWHATGIDVSSSGGDLQPRKWWAGGLTVGYLQEAIDGCLVYDASGSDTRAFSRLILSGPMVDPKLDPDGVARFERTESASAMAAFMSGSFRTMLTTAIDDPGYSGLDSVGVNRFRSLLSAVPGVKLGTVRDGRIVWDDGQITLVEFPSLA